jgi:hypothetical protein
MMAWGPAGDGFADGALFAHFFDLLSSSLAFPVLICFLAVCFTAKRASVASNITITK